MKTQQVIDGLVLLQKYRDHKDSYDIGADHEVIYAYSTTRPLTTQDIQKMIDLGWHQEYDGRDYNKDFDISDYRHDETWHAYV